MFKSINIWQAAGLTAFFLICSIPVNAQQIEDVDEAYRQARELAFEGDYEEARELCYAILEIAPDYHDVRILLARTYAWSERYSQARVELEKVLEQAPRYRDAHLALIDNELWSEHFERALEAARRASSLFPTDEEVLLKLATTHHRMESDREALRVLEQIERINPGYSEIAPLRAQIRTGRQRYSFTAAYTHDRFSSTFDPWNSAYMQFGARGSIGSIQGRLNLADRFGERAVQPEIDLYPRIADGWYGYLNVGYADHFIFPEIRLGAELYHRLPWEMEVSAGIRYLRFPDNKVTMFTGSLTKYAGNWMLTVRPYLTSDSGGQSESVQIQVRRYFADADNYVTLRGGFGFSPDERTFQSQPGDNFSLASRYIGIQGYKSLRYNLFLFAIFDLTRQELAFSPGDFFTRYTFNTGFTYRF